jgi:hypothetical protein
MASLVGFTKTCAAHSGGINTIYFMVKADLTSMTLASGLDYYDTITPVSAKVFIKYEFEEDTANLVIESIRENGAAKHSATLEFKMAKLTKEVRTSLQELFDESDCGMVGIVVDSNGNNTVIGYSEGHLLARPLRVQSANSSTGAGLTDENGVTLTLGCDSKSAPHFFVGTIPV